MGTAEDVAHQTAGSRGRWMHSRENAMKTPVEVVWVLERTAIGGGPNGGQNQAARWGCSQCHVSP